MIAWKTPDCLHQQTKHRKTTGFMHGLRSEFCNLDNVQSRGCGFPLFKNYHKLLICVTEWFWCAHQCGPFACPELDLAASQRSLSNIKRSLRNIKRSLEYQKGDSNIKTVTSNIMCRFVSQKCWTGHFKIFGKTMGALNLASMICHGADTAAMGKEHWHTFKWRQNFQPHVQQQFSPKSWVKNDKIFLRQAAYR